jgi:hypothetical protein
LRSAVVVRGRSMTVPSDITMGWTPPRSRPPPDRDSSGSQRPHARDGSRRASRGGLGDGSVLDLTLNRAVHHHLGPARLRQKDPVGLDLDLLSIRIPEKADRALEPAKCRPDEGVLALSPLRP